MKVLIGIVSKNRAQLLPLAIQSALDQDYVEKEVAVFDDASEDDTYLLKDTYPQVKWFFSKESKGYLYARNKMMSETDAAYYCSLDDDSWFLETDGLSKGVSYLIEHESAGAIAYDILSPDYPEKTGGAAEPFNVNTFIGCGHLLKLDTVRSIKFYAINPGFYGGEEKDLSIRLQDLDKNIVFLPGVHIWHDKTQVARNLPHQHRSGVCNDLVFAYRRISFPLLLIAFPGKMFNHLRFSIRTNLLKACLLGVGDFVKAFPVVMKTRKPVKNSTFYKFQKLSQR